METVSAKVVLFETRLVPGMRKILAATTVADIGKDHAQRLPKHPHWSIPILCARADDSFPWSPSTPPVNTSTSFVRNTLVRPFDRLFEI